MFRECNHTSLGGLVSGIRVLARPCGRRYVHDGTGALLPHDCDRVLARENGAAQVDAHDIVKILFGDLEQVCVAAAQAHAHVVVQDVERAPTPLRFGHDLGEVFLARHIHFERYGLETLSADE
ncbi:hypothetical protein D3C87_1630380 [compost metagenome]